MAKARNRSNGRRASHGTLAIAGALWLGSASAAIGATINVAANEVYVAANARCSLVEAVENANAASQVHTDCTGGTAGGNTIVLPAGSDYVFTTPSAPPTALPVIASTLTIQGNGAIIERSASVQAEFRLIDVAPGGNLSIDHVTLRGGSVATTGIGGAVLNRGHFTAIGCTFTGNTGAFGGAIYNDYGAVLMVTNSTIVANTSTFFYAGGVANGGTATLIHCTVSANSGNNASNGANGATGGVATAGVPGGVAPLTLIGNIISGNFCPNPQNPYQCGSGHGGSEVGDFSINIPTSIVSQYNVLGHSGVSTSDAFGTAVMAPPPQPQFIPSATDVVATSDGAHPQALASILNTVLAINAPGNTATLALPPGSIAIDAAEPGCSSLTSDQRGVARPQDADGNGSVVCDAGAFEVAAPVPPPPPIAEVPSLPPLGLLILAGALYWVASRSAPVLRA